MQADTAHEKPHVPQLTQLTSDQDLFFKLKTRDFCCTPLQFFVSCTISEAVTHFQRLWGLNIYGLEAAAMIADLFTSAGRGVALLRNVLRLCATATPVGDLEVNSLRRYAIFLCTPRAAVCLLRELGLVKERYCKLLPFLGEQNGLLRSNRLICASLNHHMQSETDIMSHFMARKSPCPTPHLAEGKKNKQPPIVLMKLLMYRWYVFGSGALKRGLEWTDSFAGHGHPREWCDGVAFVANPEPTHC